MNDYITVLLTVVHHDQRQETIKFCYPSESYSVEEAARQAIAGMFGAVRYVRDVETFEQAPRRWRHGVDLEEVVR